MDLQGSPPIGERPGTHQSEEQLRQSVTSFELLSDDGGGGAPVLISIELMSAAYLLSYRSGLNFNDWS